MALHLHSPYHLRGHWNWNTNTPLAFPSAKHLQGWCYYMGILHGNRSLSLNLNFSASRHPQVHTNRRCIQLKKRSYMKNWSHIHMAKTLFIHSHSTTHAHERETKQAREKKEIAKCIITWKSTVSKCRETCVFARIELQHYHHQVSL